MYNAAYKLLNEQAIPAFRIGQNWRISTKSPGVLRWSMEPSKSLGRNTFVKFISKMTS